jgi:hypothetical protein
MWAIAIYDLRLSASVFYELTPRQFALLVETHRRHNSHWEMIQAYTTSAVINFSMGAPDEVVQPMRYMPSYRAAQPAVSRPLFTEDEVIDWETRVAQLAAELKQGHGAMLDEIRSQSDG